MTFSLASMPLLLTNPVFKSIYDFEHDIPEKKTENHTFLLAMGKESTAYFYWVFHVKKKM